MKFLQAIAIVYGGLIVVTVVAVLLSSVLGAILSVMQVYDPLG